MEDNSKILFSGVVGVEKLVNRRKIDESFVGIKIIAFFKLSFHQTPSALADEIPSLCLFFSFTYTQNEITIANRDFFKLVDVLCCLNKYHT